MPSFKLEKDLLMLRQQHEQLFYVKVTLESDIFEFIYRPLTLAETKAVSKIGPAIPPYLVNEEICKWCILAGDPIEPGALFTTAIASLADHLSDNILSHSGFNDPENFVRLLDEKRTTLDTLEGGIEAFICTAFHGLTPLDVQNMTLHQQVDRLAKAERMIGNQLPVGMTAQSEKGKARKRQSAEAAWLTSKEAADKIDVNKEALQQREFVTGGDLLDMNDDG
jgi:hypothetical protein